MDKSGFGCRDVSGKTRVIGRVPVWGNRSFLAKALPAWLKSQRLLTEKAVKYVCHSEGMVGDRLDFFFRLMKRLRNASRWQRKTGKPW